MPLSKNQNTRIRIINECLSQKNKYWSLEQLVKKIASADISISESSIKKDLKEMKTSEQLKYFAPIKYNKLHDGYHYTDPDYSIDKIPLNKEDIKALEIAASTLKQYQYIPLMKEFTGAVDKIIRVVNRVKRDEHKSVLEFIEFEKTPIALGIEFMDEIVNAILNSRVLKMTYQKFAEPSKEVLIHPYFIKEYRNRWYLIGLNEHYQKIRTYAYDRMISIEQVDFPVFKINNYINTETYLRNCIGINQMDDKIEKVILIFNSKEGKYIKTQKLHHSQTIVSDDSDYLTVGLQLIINFELIGIILSYGANVKVLEPKSLADKIMDITTKTANQYI